MKKIKIERIIGLIPDVLKNTSEWFKQNLTENGKEILGNASGSIGILIKIIGVPLLDKYLANQTKNRLADFGINTYLKAAYIQAANSVAIIENEIKSQKNCEEFLEIIAEITTKNFENITQENVLLIFQPQYHPIIKAVKDEYIEMLEYLGIEQQIISEFRVHFNNNIEETIKKEFGEDYEKHLVDISDFITDKKEAELITDTIRLGRIGFSSSENLGYEHTYGYWKPVGKLRESDYYKEDSTRTDEDEEKKLQLVTKLIEEFFNTDENNLDRILFIIADFGKGKSVFMRRYASLLAKQYQLDREGYFPIYFNLRDYKTYFSTDSKLGIINDFLQSKYGINIEDEKYINKRFVFLMDSLDESGELIKEAIAKVVSSVKQIQNLDRTKYRNNRIIITSRPLNEGFENEIRCHKPYEKKNNEGRLIDCFISLYGFKKSQFNNWLSETLKRHQLSLPTELECGGFVAEILCNIKKDSKIDIYDILLRNKTLQKDELRRPIFAYMIYQLIINKIDFIKSGKIGVYLSFLNLLTKDAKHINDPSYKVKLEEEFQFRNLLHATAALWMYKRNCGKQGFLSKADLCRVIEGRNNEEPDEVILERNRKNGIVEIEFLSHSYFGEDGNTLYFQHQSFAEILLAEYYLKLFLKYALEEEEDIEKARARLHLGEPTEQTINFFIELLHLLKDAAEEYAPGKEDILEKRKLLFPLLASLSNKKFNTLFCNSLFYQWYKNYVNIEENQAEYPYEALINWGIKKNEIEKLIDFAAKVLDTQYDYIISQIKTEVNLFNNDVVILHDSKVDTLANTIDKWFCLLIGDVLYTNVTNSKKVKLFNMDYKINSKVLTTLMAICRKISHHYDWHTSLFRGFDTRNCDGLVIKDNLIGLDLSYSYLKNVVFFCVSCGDVNLSRTILDNVTFLDSRFGEIKMDDVIIKNNIEFGTIYVNGVIVNSFNNFFSYQDKEPIYIPAHSLALFCINFSKILRVIGHLPFLGSKNTFKDNVNFIPEKINDYFWEIYEKSLFENEKLYKTKIKQMLKEVYGKDSKDISNIIKMYF